MSKPLLVQIFTEDLTEVETLPRDKVLNFLKDGFKELAIPYLEHIIYVWDEKGPEFHNVLIQLYLERVQGPMKEYLKSLPEGNSKGKLESLSQYFWALGNHKTCFTVAFFSTLKAMKMIRVIFLDISSRC